MAEDKKCFIIMPISTPDFMLEKYHDGKDHFKHVLQCLFMPSVEKAGYQAIPPTAKGTDLIHAEVVHNLETTEMVLCDMSCLNPNVFFEFGIRTSLNKPVCVVKDELTEQVPFDTAILNYHEYKSSLEPWHLEAEIKALSEHIAASAERSKNENTLWKYFGLKARAAPYEGESGTEAKLDYLMMKVDSLSKKLTTRWERLQRTPREQVLEMVHPDLFPLLEVVLPDRHLNWRPIAGGYEVIYYGQQMTDDEERKIRETLKKLFGKEFRLKHK